MKYIVKGALVALALAAAPIAASAPAAAAVNFGISLGNVAFAYSDGYWDRNHHWHSWRNRNEARWYQDHHPEHYVAFRHNHDRHDRDKGWHNERWWDNH